MFCYQCEETVNCTACTKVGVCGKNEEVASLQDKLIYVVKRIAKDGLKNNESDKFIMESLFMTITNVNFSADIFTKKINDGNKFVSLSNEEIDSNSSILVETNEDLRSLKEILIYGLKGLAAYLDHAFVLGYESQDVYDYVRKALTASITHTSSDDLISLILECGTFGINAMELLDKANTTKFGHPEPTSVSLDVGNNPGILISGHDLKDLKELLDQTKGTGIDIYTHGEMLPANAYPELKKYDNLVGNYGGAWWDQRKEFESFNGVILLTTNCLVPPTASYKERVYTTGLVGFDGVKHITDNANGPKDFSKIIADAKNYSSPTKLESGKITIGFAHNATLSVADKIISAVKEGTIKKFIVMAGCDGRHPDRSYYTDFAKALPKDCVILTAGCAKFRYNKLGLGDIGGIPRVIDAGQCNDSYSLVVIAKALVDAFEVKDINDLPISYNIAWYEQKAVLVLLSLLSLGVKNIRLGPKLPAFISPNVLKVLQEKFNIAGISNVKDDLDTLVLSN